MPRWRPAGAVTPLRGPSFLPGPPPDPFDVAALRVDGAVVLTVTGELDLETAPRLEAAITQAGAAPLVLDLTRLDFIDSTGLRIIVATASRAPGLAIACRPQSPPERVFAISGMHAVLRIRATREEAVAAASATPDADAGSPAA